MIFTEYSLDAAEKRRLISVGESFICRLPNSCASSTGNIPLRMPKESLDAYLPLLTKIINNSFEMTVFSAQKRGTTLT